MNQPVGVGQKKTRQKTDPTIAAMRALDKMFTDLDPQQIKMVMGWALKKHGIKGAELTT